jgi:hypothetical protein
MQQISFYICNNQEQPLRPATKTEIAHAYNALEQEKYNNKNNYNASHYQTLTNICISKQKSRNIAINHTQLDIIQLQRHFHNKHLDFDSMPSEVQLVLVDIAYNSGLGTAREYHSGQFMHAIEKGDWSKAAEYVKEFPSPYFRKIWRYNLLKKVQYV